MSTYTILTSKDMVFHEKEFSFKTTFNASSLVSLLVVSVNEDAHISPLSTQMPESHHHTLPYISNTAPMHSSLLATTQSSPKPIRQSIRVKHKPSWLKDFVSNIIQSITTLTVNDVTIQSKPQSSHYTPNTFLYDKSIAFSSAYIEFLANMSSI